MAELHGGKSRCGSGVIRRKISHNNEFKVKSRNLSKGRLDMVVELRVKDESGLVSEVAALDGMIGASLIAHDGEVTF